MSTPASPRLLKWWLGIQLTQLRKGAGKERNQIAEHLRVSKQTIGSMETGRTLPDYANLKEMLGFYGEREKLDWLGEVVNAAKEGSNWWNRLSDVVPSWFDLFLGLESGAVELSIYANGFVPGLFQTSAYAELAIRSDPGLSGDQVQRALKVRLGRQRILQHDDDPVRMSAVLDEAVLHRTFGSPAVLAQQLDHLLELSSRPRTTIQILPFGSDAHLGGKGSFQILRLPDEFAGIPRIAYLDLLTEAEYYDKPAQIRAYERALTNLHARAASREESRAIIERRRAEIGRASR